MQLHFEAGRKFQVSSLFAFTSKVFSQTYFKDSSNENIINIKLLCTMYIHHDFLLNDELTNCLKMIDETS